MEEDETCILINIKEKLLKNLPKELVNKIIYNYKALEHPTSKLIKNVVKDCKEYIYNDSGGWEIFISFTEIEDKLSKMGRTEKITLEYYIYGLGSKW